MSRKGAALAPRAAPTMFDSMIVAGAIVKIGAP
jgi:hypothetical protein